LCVAVSSRWMLSVHGPRQQSDASSSATSGVLKLFFTDTTLPWIHFCAHITLRWKIFFQKY
jgi:hypothetical protein